MLLFVFLLDQLHLFLELTDASGTSFTKSTLGGTILSLAFGGRSVGGGLATGLGTWWNDPFFTGQGKWRLLGRSGGSSGGRGCRFGAEGRLTGEDWLEVDRGGWSGSRW